MGKALKTVGVIIGGAALIATGVGALAMPALAGTTTLFGVSVGTLNTISSGLVAVGGLLDKPKSQGSAQPDEWTSNPDQPIPFLMGRMGIAGKIVQRDEFGPDNMYQGIVGILSGAGPIAGVTAFSGDKQPVTFGANGIAVTSQWQGEMWMVRRSGAQPDTALTVPAGLKSGGAAFEWSPAAKLSGKACYLQILGENSKGTAFPAGVPDPMHVADGIFGYDPRYDDTYPGGAGPCRLGVRSTYRWIEDGGIGGLNWALGLVENGQVVGGIGASLDGIDVPAFVEVANIADANNWKLAAWPDTSEDVSAVLDQLLQAAGAVRARHAGKISCVSRGAPRASVATITARDTAGDIELDTAPSLFNRLNTITPRFMSEAAGWVLTPADPVSFAQYVTDDGGKHSDQIDYRFVSDLKQAAELAAYDILDAREPFSGTIPLKPHMRHLKRGDTFLVSEPGFLMDGVKCIVLSRSYDPKTAQVRIGFRSETDSKHALALGKTTTLPEFPVLTPTDPTFVTPPAPGDWTVTVPGPAPDGSQLPNIDLTGLVSNDTADALLISWRAVASGENPNTPPLYLDPDGNVLPGWMDAGSYAPTIRSLTIQGPKSGAVVWLALRYRRGSNFSAAELKGPITVRTLVADVMPNAPGLSQIRSDIEAAFGDIFNIDGLLTQARTDIDAQGTEIAAARGGQGDLSARLSQLNQFRMDGDTALGASITSLTARTANTEADIIDIENAAANDRTATAQAISQVAARSGHRPNLIDNPSGDAGFRSWLKEGSAATQTLDDRVVGRIFVVANYMVSRVYPAVAGDQHSLSFNASPPGAGGHVRIQYVTPGGFVEGVFVASGSGAIDERRRSTTPSTAPSGTTGFRLVVASPSGGVLPVWGIKVNFGAVAADFSDDYSATVLEASVTEQSLAIIDLENNQAIASFRKKVDATGGKPTILEMVSGSFGSYIALTAEQLYFGDNTVFDDATDTLRTTIGQNIRVLAFGAPFGAQGNLLEWWGPASTALSNMATGNGLNGRMTTEPYVFDNVIGGGRTGGTRSFSSGPGGTSAASTVQNVLAGSLIEMSGALNGGSLNADAPLYGTLSLYETSSAGQSLVYSEPVTVETDGLVFPNGSFGAQGVSIGSPRRFAARAGNVTYSVSFTRTGGSSYVNGATLSGGVIITPPA